MEGVESNMTKRLRKKRLKIILNNVRIARKLGIEVICNLPYNKENDLSEMCREDGRDLYKITRHLTFKKI